MEDYRRINFNEMPIDIKLKKNALKNKITQEHKGARNFYLKIREKRGDYFKPFADIYKNTCTYCGLNSDLAKLDYFQIDHIKCESSFKKTDNTIDRIEAGQIENLTLSCQKCNHDKSDYLLSSDTIELLDLDNNGIIKIFKRDKNDFYIKIDEQYSSNIEICGLYNKLNLFSEDKRLMYLIYAMKDYYNKLYDLNKKEKLHKFIELLIKKYNTFI